MKTVKNLLSMLLAFTMILSFASVGAFAEGNEALLRSPDGTESEKASLAEAIRDAQDGDTVLLLQSVSIEGALLIDKAVTLDLNDKTLTFTADDGGAAIQVKGSDVTIRNGVIKTAAGENAAYDAAILAEEGVELTLDNMTLEHEGETMLASGGANITVYEGSYSSDPSAYLPEGYSAALQDGMYVVTKDAADSAVNPEDPAPETPKDEEPAEEPVTEEPAEEEPKTEEPAEEEPGTEETKDLPQGTVKTADGKDPAAMEYHKRVKTENSTLGGDQSFLTNYKPTKLVIGSTGKELAFTVKEESAGFTMTIGEKENKALLDTIAAGAHTVEVQFDGAKPAALKLNVYMDLSLDTSRHVKGSGSPIVATVTDQPDSVLISDNSDLTGYKKLTEGTDYTVSGTTVTLTAEYLDSLADAEKAVTKYLGFQVLYDGKGIAVLLPITILPPPSIDPVSADWKRSADREFTVKPDVLSVSIDGKEVPKENYTVSGTKLSFPRGKAVAELSYGEHTLTVETSSGPVSAKITIEPSLGYSSTTGNKYTLGSSRGLIFIASDPVVKVKVNGKELSPDNYKLSDDKKSITLKTTYLRTLKAGDYTITATVTAGDKEAEVSTPFTIVAGSYNGRTPQTGDPNGEMWLVLLLLSGAAFTALLPKLKKQ